MLLVSLNFTDMHLANIVFSFEYSISSTFYFMLIFFFLSLVGTLN